MDGISWQYKGMDKSLGNVSEWTVTPDWEETMGLVHNLYHVAHMTVTLAFT